MNSLLLKNKLLEGIKKYIVKLLKIIKLLEEYIERKLEEERMKNDFYTNRELSWLQFNERVLDEAGNPDVPLAERLSFAAIYGSNLDEFFMVRVGTLMMQMRSDETIRENKTGMSAKQQVKAILSRVKELDKKKCLIYEQLMGELEPEGVRLINFNKLSKAEGKLLEEYFDSHIAPFLSPTVISKQHPFPFLANKALYAVVFLTSSKGKKKIGIVPCSNNVFKRLIEIPTRPGYFMLSEELILHFVSKLYSNYKIHEKAVIRVTRNADIDGIDILDEDLDYRNTMEQLIKKRTRLDPVRFEFSRELSADSIEKLATELGIKVSQMFLTKTPLDLSFVFQLQDYLRDKKELFYEKRSPRNSKALDIDKSILEQVKKKDVLLSYPFESMKPFIKMLQEAAKSEDVVSIKMTLYRVAERSQIVDALIEAAENGKEVIVIMELRARFDEANNIEMSRRLEESGCQLLYGLDKYKVHSKLCLITKKEKDGFSYITQIGTGNYNEKTSRLYTDLSLITGEQEIGAEAAKVFMALQKDEVVESTEHLLVAPKCLQNKVLELMDEQIEKSKNGGEGYIGVKINSLTDKKIIDKLIEASMAGVQIELIVRGICCIKPGIKGVTENIKVISVVGRFLEHSRIYRFGKGDDAKIYIASADFMTRNTIRRVEVAVPIYDADIRKRICDIFDTIMKDNVKGKEQGQDGLYHDREKKGALINSQEFFYEKAYEAEK